MAIIPNHLPPLELLQELFEISKTSPSGLRWKNPTTRSKRLKPGDVAGTKSPKGYWNIGITTDKKRLYLAHRIVYFLQTGDDPGNLQVDHVNGKQDPLTLRLATPSENMRNSPKLKNKNGITCSSRHKGVSWSKREKKWKSYIRVDGKPKHLGYFKSEIEAAKVYNKAAILYHKEFAFLNELK